MLMSSLYPLVLFLNSAVAQGTCFYPDGTDASKDDQQWPYSACNSTAKYSACCNFAENDVCVSNGLCYYPGTPDDPRNYIYRGACTDESWSDGSCATYCRTKAPSHYESLIFCPNTTQFCCQKSVQGGNCCDQADLRFSLDLSQDVMQKLIHGNNGTALTTGGRGPTASGSSAGSTSSSTSTAVTRQPTGLSKGAKAGIIVAALSACALFGVGWFFGRRKDHPSTVGQFVRRFSKQSSKEDEEIAHGRNSKSETAVDDGEKPALAAVESPVSPTGNAEEPSNAIEVQQSHELPERGDPAELAAQRH